MRSTMEYDGSLYWLHVVFATNNNDVYIMRVSPDSSGTGDAHRLNNEVTNGFSAVFVGAGTMTFSGTGGFIANEMYWAGASTKYTAFQANSVKNFVMPSYMVVPLIEDAKNCHRANPQFVSIAFDLPAGFAKCKSSA